MTFATQLASAFTPISAVYDSASVSQALSWAQGFVEEYCNRGPNGFDLVTNDLAVVDPLAYRQALLPRIPVTAVSSVLGLLPSSTSGGMAWKPLPNVAFVKDTGLLYDTTGEPGVSWNFGPSWPSLPGSLQVTYSHGYATIPSALINAACRFAQQYLENPALLLQRNIGSFDERYAGNTGGVGIVINSFDERVMDRYTLISIA
jgi:hypothetical protein